MGTQLIQLREEGHSRLNMVVKTNELEDHQDSLAVGMQLGDQKLMESKDINKKWVYREPKTCL